MNNTARTEATIGEIVNLMSVDAEHIEDINGFLSGVWSSPLEVLVSLALLYFVVGYAILAGLAVIVLLVIANAFMSWKYQILQKKLMETKDDRIKLMTEILNGIKVSSPFLITRIKMDLIKSVDIIELSIGS